MIDMTCKALYGLVNFSVHIRISCTFRFVLSITVLLYCSGLSAQRHWPIASTSEFLMISARHLAGWHVPKTPAALYVSQVWDLLWRPHETQKRSMWVITKIFATDEKIYRYLIPGFIWSSDHRIAYWYLPLRSLLLLKPIYRFPRFRWVSQYFRSYIFWKTCFISELWQKIACCYRMRYCILCSICAIYILVISVPHHTG